VLAPLAIAMTARCEDAEAELQIVITAAASKRGEPSDGRGTSEESQALEEAQRRSDGASAGSRSNSGQIS
jgi:hypothetical protein